MINNEGISMDIKGIEGQTADKLNWELQRGGKFVIYQYCISIVVISFKRSSDIYFIKADESRVKKGLLYSSISLICGWWGIPWGPIYSISTMLNNFRGGKDVTPEVLAALNDEKK
jgi:hypothetical protein